MNDRRQPPRCRLVPPSTGIGRRRLIQIGAAGAAGVFFGGNVLAACGDDDDAGAADTDDRAATTAGTHGGRGTSPGTTPATGGGAALDKLRLGFAYIGPINDNGWTQEHHRGRQLVFDTLGAKVEGTFVENVLFDPARDDADLRGPGVEPRLRDRQHGVRHAPVGRRRQVTRTSTSSSATATRTSTTCTRTTSSTPSRPTPWAWRPRCSTRDPTARSATSAPSRRPRRTTTSTACSSAPGRSIRPPPCRRS